MPSSSTRFLRFIAVLLVVAAGSLLFLALRPGPRAAPLAVDPTGAVTLTLGSADAPVEVWVGSDYQCPDCARYENDAMPAILARFIETGRVRWRYLLFALPGHEEAGPATHAFACGQAQGEHKALAMHEGLFRTQDQWSRSPDHGTVFRSIAAEAGLDLAAWEGCMQSGRFNEAIARGWAEAQRVGIPGTPTLLLHDRFYVGGLTANQLARLLTGPLMGE